ncbi:MAG: hypothetical protein M3Q03_08575 [Chloroflexota bacterium]|nr:hypothetical protein [Chloroflexota bacterium]
MRITLFMVTNDRVPPALPEDNEPGLAQVANAALPQQPAKIPMREPGALLFAFEQLPVDHKDVRGMFDEVGDTGELAQRHDAPVRHEQRHQGITPAR